MTLSLIQRIKYFVSINPLFSCITEFSWLQSYQFHSYSKQALFLGMGQLCFGIDRQYAAYAHEGYLLQ